MSAELNVLTLEVDDETAAKIRALLEQGDKDALDALVHEKAEEASREQLKRDMEVLMMRETILNVHHCTHTEQFGRAQKLLCFAATLFEAADDPGLPDLKGLLLFLHEMQELSSERAKHSCAGSA